MSVLVTGVAGFVGSQVARALLARGEQVVGVDNFSPYYDPILKFARLKPLREDRGFSFIEGDIADRDAMLALADSHKHIDRIVHLAAQPGVRQSVADPYIYVQTNVMGHLTMVELARRLPGLKHFVYASSSSVYGGNHKLPFSVADNVDHPVSVYAATKRAGELLSETYVHLYKLRATGLRYFTVYGPWGRPDMALFLFTANILAGKPIDVFNYGKHKRDFTYVSDIAAGVVAAVDHIAAPDPQWNSLSPNPATSRAPYRVYNIGNQRAIELLRYIEVLEHCLGRKAQKNLLPMQPGDVPDTLADVESLAKDVGYLPSTPVEVGVERFVEWYRSYYH
jgi:UDP-glucuronate 4-epimerase